MTSPQIPAPNAPIAGDCDPRFERLREAFASNFADHAEVGAALCVVVDGVRVVDLWGGHRDAERRSPWQRDTIVNAYSVGKGVISIVLLAAVEQGRLDLDAPVARIWPEFAAAGKSAVTVRTLLCHQAGLPAVRKRLPAEALFDWCAIPDALAREAPYWEPGSDHGYHPGTFGFLIGELVRRATGLSVPEALAHYVTGPLDADYYFGVPHAALGRASEVHGLSLLLEDEAQWAMAFPPTGDDEHDRMVWHAYFNPIGLSGMGIVNSAAWRTASVPSANGHGTARAIASIYAALLSGGPPATRWPGQTLLAEATSIHSDGMDRLLRRPSRFGLGFQISQPERPIGLSERGFGHYGHGGSLGFADPEAQVALGYLINRPGDRWQTPRVDRIMNALRDCL